MRPKYGDDTAIACCVSAMAVGKQMQFFGARVNVAKALLYAINGGRDERTGKLVVSGFEPVTDEYLDHATVAERYDAMLDWLARTYVHALDVIHYMHDKYAYERLEMALHDREILRTMACGIAGLSVAADSLSAIKHARVRVIRDETGLATDYEIEGDYPAYGNNDDRADAIARGIVHDFMEKVRKHPTYRGAAHTQSVLTITSNVVYGKKTGNTPDGRRSGAPFAPGANPMNGRDEHGYIASALSVAKLPYDDAEDGISLTNTITPDALGRTPEERIRNLMRRSGRIHGERRLPHERQRARQGDSGRRHGAPGALPAADHPGLRIRGQLRAADPRAAARRHQPHFPRLALILPDRSEPLNRAASGAHPP